LSKEKKEKVKAKPSGKKEEETVEKKTAPETAAPQAERPRRRRRPAAKKVRRRKPGTAAEKPETPKAEPEKPEEEKAELEEKPSEEKLEEEEEKPEEETEEEIVEERLYTIPLRITNWVPRWKRTPRAVRFVREFITRHMKPDNVLIMPEVNEALWARGLKKPPRRIRVRAVKNADGDVKIYLASA